MNDGDQYKLGYLHGYEDGRGERDYDPGNRWEPKVFQAWLAEHDREQREDAVAEDRRQTVAAWREFDQGRYAEDPTPWLMARAEEEVTR